MNAQLNISIEHNFEGTDISMLNVVLSQNGERVQSTGIALNSADALLGLLDENPLDLLALAIDRLAEEAVVR